MVGVGAIREDDDAGGRGGCGDGVGGKCEEGGSGVCGEVDPGVCGEEEGLGVKGGCTKGLFVWVGGIPSAVFVW